MDRIHSRGVNKFSNNQMESMEQQEYTLPGSQRYRSSRRSLTEVSTAKTQLRRSGTIRLNKTFKRNDSHAANPFNDSIIMDYKKQSIIV